jgi:chromosome segregation ATPase
MVTLEQVRQLETKIGKMIDYVNRVNGENVHLRGELDGRQKRIAELEETVQQFREEQSRIEEGIIAALDRLDEFEDAVCRGFSNVQAVVAAAAPAVAVDEEDEDLSPTEQELEGPVEDAPPNEESLDEEPPDGKPLDGEPPPQSEETEAGELDIF